MAYLQMVFALCYSSVFASGLTSGHYHFQAQYAPVCLYGTYPITAGNMTTQCYLRVNIDASGVVSGILDIRTVPGSATGTFTSQNNVTSVHVHAVAQDPVNIVSDIDAQLSGTSVFIGTATVGTNAGPATMDVSAAGPLNVTFDVDLVVNQSRAVTGSGMASSCGVQVPVNVTGTNGPTNCALHFVGANLPQFVWDGSGPPTQTGFTAAWTGNGFGAAASGSNLAIVAPTGTPTPTPTVTPTATPTPTPTPTATPTPTPTPAPGCQLSTSSVSNFNGTPIKAGNYIWFNSVLKPSGLGSKPVTFRFVQQMISSASFTTPVPDAIVTFDPAATSATTSFTGGTWMTRLPASGLAGNTFLSGVSYRCPANIPGGLKNITWSGMIISDTPGASLQWQWAAAVYSAFGSDNGGLGVKPVDDNKASQYKNSDHAGTPENFKSNVVGGATGGGGSNYTGGYSGTVSVGPCPR